jgi:tetratricopeptide (TPR) repeat protein
MSYPGSPDLDQKVQQRILTAFGESVRLYREGHSEECRTILRSILEVDPRFSPAQRLEDAIGRGGQVDLGQLLGELAANAPVRADETLARARDAMAKREFQEALMLSQSILRELPGHAGARSIALDAQAKIKASSEVEAHLSRAEDALGAGMVEEATGFVKMALAADPSHPRLAALSRRLQEVEAAAQPDEAEPLFQFETFTPQDDPVEAARPSYVPPPPVAARPAAPPAPPVPPPVVPPPAPAWSGAPAAAAVPAPPAPPVAPPQVAAPQTPGAPQPSPLFSFDEASGEVDFATPPDLPFEPAAGAAGTGDEAGSKVAELLDQGQMAFDQGDFQGAIDTWSRIYLVDAHNTEAERRIEQARRHREEIERLAEHRFYEAREAFDQGRRDEARSLCMEVLKLLPQHLEAHDLLTRLETPAAPPPPPSDAAGDVDLFKDDFVPAKLTTSPEPAGRAAAASLPMERPVVKASRRPAAAGRRLPVSVPLIAAIGGMVLVLVFVGLLLRGTVFSGGARAVNAAIAEADRLAAAGKLQEAITLLQNTEAEGEEANRLNQKALEFARQLRAKTKAAPAVSSGEVRRLIGEGKHVKAWQAVKDGLAKVPGDPELMQLKSELSDYSTAIGPLAEAVSESHWDSVRTLSGQLLERHPTDGEAERLWRVGTFNAAVGALRSYQVATAHRLLVELSAKGNDPEVKRLEELSSSYLARPVDPRYQIFVSSIELRPAG